MNRFEKNILENEMGIDSTPAVKEIEDAEDPIDNSSEEKEEIEPYADTFPTTDGGEQLKIDDEFLGSDEDNDQFFLYGYQDELDLSSLDESITDSDTDKDGDLLYQETVKLLETEEIELEDGIALLKKNACEGHALSWIYLGQLYSDQGLSIYNPTFALDCYRSAAKLDFGEGYYNLGLCYYSGFGCDTDYAAAVNCFTDGACIFNPDCICALGMCYEFGIGCEINYEYAFNLYEKGTELGHARAANNLGGCYFYGHGVKKDRKKAIEIYALAASLGSSDAECRLGILCEEANDDKKDMDAAIAHYKRAVKAKNPAALYKLGLCYRSGNGLEQNFSQAFKCFIRSANLGYDPAKYEAGKLCVDGRGVKKDPERAYKLFMSASQNGYVQAHYEVANCFLEGIGTMKDWDSAYKYFQKSYELDESSRALSSYKIGICHLKAREPDKKGALEWFDISAKLKNAEALYMLGECYFFGVGTALDANAAYNAFTEAEALASDGDDAVLLGKIRLALAQCCEHGIGTHKEPEKAILYYRKAAESGTDEAVFCAGRAIAQGIGMKAEYAAARPLILRAARRGYVPAMFMMGMLSDEGRGVARNLNDAEAWYLKVVSSAKEPQMQLYDFPERFLESMKLYTESKIKAQYKLGMLIARAATEMSGYARSFEHIAMSASMGYGGAQNEVARIYASGGDLAEYYNSPFFVPDARFEGGDTLIGKEPLADAMNKLGDTFYDGKGFLKKNDAAAARCYRYAAELGHTDGCYSYGWCLRHGVGVHENDVEAAKWLKTSADKGNSNAAYSYGLCCEEGAGTGVKNKREAIYYYRLAAGLGHADAAKRFLKLTKAEE